MLRAVQVSGGEVTRALRGDSVVYQATGSSIALQLVAPDSSAQGATLTLDGTDYVGRADSTGRIRVSPVLAGRYRAAIRTPVMDLLGVPPMQREVTTHDDARAFRADRTLQARTDDGGRWRICGVRNERGGHGDRIVRLGVRS